MTVKDMRKLLEYVEECGFGDEHLSAEHDEIFIPGPDPIEFPQCVHYLEECGAIRSKEYDHWFVFV